MNSEHGKGGDEINLIILMKQILLKFWLANCTYGEPYFGPNLKNHADYGCRTSNLLYAIDRYK